MAFEKTWAEALAETGRTIVDLVADDGRVRLSRVGYEGTTPWMGNLSYPSKAAAIRCGVARGYLVRAPGRLLPYGMKRFGQFDYRVVAP